MIQDRIREIEDEIRRTPYNKATQHHIGKLKAKLAKLKLEALKEASRGRGGGRAYSIKKSGDATVVLVGFPSVGKSTLLNALTDANSKVAGYAFTTLGVEPGMMEHMGARIQILDVPGLLEGASRGRGKGKEVLSVVRAADLLLILLDARNPGQLEVIAKELYDAGLRLDKRPPAVKIERKAKGGMTISSTARFSKLSVSMAKEALKEFGVHNAEVVIAEDITLDEFLDVLAGNRIYVKSLLAVNKVDLLGRGGLEKMGARLGTKDYHRISALRGENLESLKEAIFEKLGFIRIYLKPQGGEADHMKPLIMPDGATVRDVCDRLHGELKSNFKYAHVWGSSARFSGQRVGLGHRLMDGDELTVVGG